jgi:hypothetical protein
MIMIADLSEMAACRLRMSFLPSPVPIRGRDDQDSQGWGSEFAQWERVQVAEGQGNKDLKRAGFVSRGSNEMSGFMLFPPELYGPVWVNHSCFEQDFEPICEKSKSPRILFRDFLPGKCEKGSDSCM